MISALIQKEWKKTKYVIFFAIAILSIALFHFYFSINNALEHNAPSDIFQDIIRKEGTINISFLVYIISFIGPVLAFFQFSQEVAKGRLRIHLHFPLKQNFLIHFFSIYGVFVLSSIFLIANIILFLSLTKFFPIEIFYAVETKFLISYFITLCFYFAIAVFLINPVKMIKIGVLVISILVYLLFTEYTRKFFVGQNLYYYFPLVILSYYLLLFASFKLYTKGYIK